MKRTDKIAKSLMYAFRSSVKNKHVDAFVRYNSTTKLRNLLRVEYAIRRGKIRDFGFPYMLTIEPTNRCNLSCPLCPTGKGLVGRELQDIDMTAFRRVIDEIGQYVYMINFQNWGEPMLAQQLPDMIAFAHSRRIGTTVATNGNYSPKLKERILESGLDNIVFAIDGSNQALYSQYRVNGKLDLVKRNVRELMRLRDESGFRRPYVEVQFLVFEHNRADIPEIRKLATECGADGLLIRAAVAPGNSENRKKFYTWNEERDFCRRFWYTASINADLGVTPCCNFFYRQDDLANLTRLSFAEAWNGLAYVENRRAVASRDYERLHQNCKDCKKYSGSLGCESYGVAPVTSQPPGPLHEISVGD